MTTAASALWRNYLVRARWYQGKGLPVDEFTITALPWVVEGPVSVRSELAHVTTGTTTETYHLLVGYLPAGTAEPAGLVGQAEVPGLGVVDVVDAPRSPTALRAWLGGLAATPGMRWLEAPPDPASPTKVFPGEQSNTTVRIGDGVLFKLFRRLSPGPNLEAEMLSRLARSGITPRLIGSYSTPDGALDLGIFCERIPDARDGWAYCVDACRAGQPVTAEMTALGSTLRRLHAALAEAYGWTSLDATALSGQMLQRLDAATGQVAELAEWRDELRAILDLPPGAVAIQRVHGDFHLGQALVSPSGWRIIDFEGEPLKTPAERRAPDAVWRDVAGLTRSLDYARSAHPDPTGEGVRRWLGQARAAFLRGYLGDTPLPTALLTAYEVDKAIYELVYEVRNRPTWAAIPRGALAEAIAASLQGGRHLPG